MHTNQQEEEEKEEEDDLQRDPAKVGIKIYTHDMLRKGIT